MIILVPLLVLNFKQTFHLKALGLYPVSLHQVYLCGNYKNFVKSQLMFLRRCCKDYSKKRKIIILNRKKALSKVESNK